MINFTNTENNKNLIDAYVESNIRADYKDTYKEYVPIVSQRINKVCNNWLIAIQNTIIKNPKLDECNLPKMSLDVDGINLLTTIFKSKIDCIFTTQNMGAFGNCNELFADVLKVNCFTKVINAFWTFDNPELYKNSNSTYNPKELGNILYNALKQGENVDFCIKSSDGAKIPAHSLILKIKSEYFSSLLSGNFGDSATEATLDYSESIIRKFVQFLYTNQLDKCRLNEMIELFLLADQLQVKDLFDFCNYQLNNFLISNRNLKDDQIYQLLNLPPHLSNDNILIALNQLESRSFDLDQINPIQYLHFYKVAVENKLSKISQELETRLQPMHNSNLIKNM